MALTRLRNTSLQFILFGGKGGVGKTTMAVAIALELAKEKKVLLFTTDPAPSLTDNFGQVIGHKPTAIVGTNNLFAMEIDASKVMQEFKETYARDILEAVCKGQRSHFPLLGFQRLLEPLALPCKGLFERNSFSLASGMAC